MRPSFVLLLLTWSLSVMPAAAQVQSRPTDAPIVTADNEPWYVNGEPVQFAGDLYYPAGASIFFNGNTMVRSGNYNGVPLYTDTTQEPFSVIYVPLPHGAMQPFERRRRGDVAGTTASRTPSFPVSVSASGGTLPEAAAAPTGLPAPTGAIGTNAPETPVGTSGTSIPSAVGTGGVVAAPPRPSRITMSSIGRPASNDGVWIPYLGEKWVSAGTAVPLTDATFRAVGQYEGFPVYARRDVSEQVIYLPTREGLAAPYRLKQ